MSVLITICLAVAFVAALVLAQRLRDSLAASAAAREAAERASESKGQFLANMSHEIRTPLNGIMGMTDLTLGGELGVDQRRNLVIVKDSAEALLRIIDDILDYSKVEAGRLELEHVPFDLYALLDSLTDTFGLQATRQDLVLTCDLDPSTPRWLVGDAGRLRQVLVNLLGNAIKFTPEGCVSLSVVPDSAGVAGQPLAEIRLHFAVTDTGIGIDPMVCEHIFDAFAQADPSTTRQFGGTGLGLAISRRLLDLMGSTLAVSSTPGQGSRFYFDLALPRADSPGGASDSWPAAPGHSIIVAVQEDVVGHCLAGQLGALGYNVVVLTGITGQAPIAVAMTGADPDWIFYETDLVRRFGPAWLDGWKAARRCAVARIGDHADDAASHAGACARLTLPIKPTALLELLNGDHRDQSCSEPDANDEVDQRPLDGLEILLVEDNPINQTFARLLLNKLGAKVHIGSEGTAGLSFLAHTPVDVVLTDVQMPVMDGLTMTRTIRDREREQGGHEHVPIVGVTAHALQTDRDRCLDAGMDGYVSKPINAGELVAVIEKVLATEPISS